MKFANYNMHICARTLFGICLSCPAFYTNHTRQNRYKLVYTDHSLFGFADAASIHINQVMRFILSDFDHGICVSNTCRENLALRARLHPILLSTIPNAVDPDKFTPDQRRGGDEKDNRINVVIVSRLVYRKGIDLVAKVIPVICARYPRVHFIVGGDGNKKLLLEEMREKHQLQDRVEMLGRVPHAHVRDVLVRGHIFLNCSLTESFCIAILEAASCGLFVVSTCVGGVPEVLPPSMIKFAEPTAESLIAAIGAALPLAEKVVPAEFHQRVSKASCLWLFVHIPLCRCVILVSVRSWYTTCEEYCYRLCHRAQSRACFTCTCTGCLFD